MGKKAREKKYRVARKMAELGIPPDKAKEVLRDEKEERRYKEKNRTGAFVATTTDSAGKPSLSKNGKPKTYIIHPRILNMPRFKKGERSPRSLAFPQMLNGKLIV